MYTNLTIEELTSTDPGMALDVVCVRVPAAETPLGQPLGLSQPGVHCLRVRTGSMAFAIGVNTRVKTGRLLVSFHGARNDSESGASMFKRLTWAEPLQSAVLAISDPLIESTWRTTAPRCTNFFGWLDDEPDAEINALIDQVASELGVPPEGITLMGSSAGATTAMRVAASRRVGRVLLSNPLLDLDGVRRYLDAWLFEQGRSQAEFAACRASKPWRFEPVVAWERGLAAGNDLRALYMQSRNDRLTANRQFPWACQHLGLDPAQGGPSADGRIVLALHDSDRHGAMPLQEILPLADAVFATAPPDVARATFPLLTPGSWIIPGHILEKVEARREETQRRAVLAAAGRVVAAQDGQAEPPLPPLDPPCSGGSLILSGCLGSVLDEAEMSLLALDRVVAGQGGRKLRRPGKSSGEATIPQPPPGQWDIYAVPRLLGRQHDPLADLPQVRVLFLLRNPLDAVLTLLDDLQDADDEDGGAEAAGGPASDVAGRPSDDLLQRAVKRWNHSIQALKLAMRSHGQRILVLRQTDTALAWQQAAAWLGRELAMVPRTPEGSAALPPWLDESARQLIVEQADLMTYRQLLLPRHPVDAPPADPLVAPQTPH